MMVLKCTPIDSTTHVLECEPEQLVVERTNTIDSSESSQPPAEEISLGEFLITAYCHCSQCCGKSDGITSTGTVATESRTIAVDPTIIPYGTKVKIDNVVYVAEDKGGAIKGNRIDIYHSTHQAALEYGKQSHEVFVLEKEDK